MTHSKNCFKCQTVKPLDEFYKHLKMADGHLNKCKECSKKDVSKHRLENIEKIREYDRQRGKLDHRIALAVEFNRAWRAEDKRRVAAHNAVSKALRAGTLQKLPCIRCQSEKSVAHHEDYDNKLDVMWLCQPCHKERHKELINRKGKENAI
jgi:hypothetical protein